MVVCHYFQKLFQELFQGRVSVMRNVAYSVRKHIVKN
ncbi:hypothetical protein SAMN05878437_1402 [Vreelandella subglaciescola]|uniref:Uncharacterized protein n=1 Tax=Vreelandella subglaciescola TaxID=29571 RepID=A0A1M7GBY0_9GAMM|nr:hypothetical protein SAMN05878437_1402 [Halomonas subglaciescola]